MADEFITLVKQKDEEAFQVSEPPKKELSETPRSEEFRQTPNVDNTNRNFKGQQKNEVVLSFCRRHWVVLLPYIIGFLIVASIVAAFLGFVPAEAISGSMGQMSYRIFAGICLVVMTYGLHKCFNRFFNYYIQILIVTNFRVIQLDHTLYFNKDRDSIDLPEIQDITTHQSGIIKTLLNYGELIITLSSVHSSKTLRYVPHPEYHFRKINKTKREYITFRRESKERALATMNEAADKEVINKE